VIRRTKKENGASLSVGILYGTADVRAAVRQVKGSRSDITMKELTQSIFDECTDSHMPTEQRQYIAEWMAGRAVSEGFVFNASQYLGSMSESDVYIFDEEAIKGKKVGRPQKQKIE